MSVSMLLISVWFQYFFQYNFNNLYSIKTIKIVEIAYPIYQRFSKRWLCKIYVGRKVKKWARDKFPLNFFLGIGFKLCQWLASMEKQWMKKKTASKAPGLRTSFWALEKIIPASGKSRQFVKSFVKCKYTQWQLWKNYVKNI